MSLTDELKAAVKDEKLPHQEPDLLKDEAMWATEKYLSIQLEPA